MKNTHQKFGLITLLALILVITSSLTVWASEHEDAADDIQNVFNENGDLILAKCIAKGNYDFIAFMNAVIASDGIVEGVIQPYKDAIYANQCQLRDISVLEKQREGVRKAIRNSFLTCETQKLDGLEKRYVEIGAELYYIRNVVDSDVVGDLTSAVLEEKLENSPDELFYPRQKLYREMKERYVDSGDMLLEDLEVLFRNLEIRYQERRESYVDCESSAWDAVSEKWEEFTEDAGGTKKAFNDAKKDIGDAAGRVAETATEISQKGFFGSTVKARLNKQDLSVGFKEILDSTSKWNGASSGGGGTTQSEFFSTLQNQTQKFALEELENEMGTNFELLYKNTSDTTVRVFMEEMDNLNSVLVGSLEPLQNLLSCTKTINRKQQCP